MYYNEIPYFSGRRGQFTFSINTSLDKSAILLNMTKRSFATANDTIL